MQNDDNVAVVANPGGLPAGSEIDGLRLAEAVPMAHKVAQADAQLLDVFHASSPEQKWEMIGDMEDSRARLIARWLVGSEWPEFLSLRERRAIGEEFRDHLMLETAPWTTIPSALRKIDELKGTAMFRQKIILSGYRQYLTKQRDQPPGTTVCA